MLTKYSAFNISEKFVRNMYILHETFWIKLKPD